MADFFGVGTVRTEATLLDIAILVFGTPPSITNGAAVAAHTLTLPRNGTLSSFTARLRVVRAEWFAARDVAQVRDGGNDGEGNHLIVVDFGTSRTVAAVASSTSTITISSVQRWLGAAFDGTPLSIQPALIGGATVFASEVRSERLLISCSATSLDAARSALAVQLPEIPADLELRIDGGAPLWTSPGTVTAGALPADTPPLRLAVGAAANGTQRWRSISGAQQDDLASYVQDVDLAAPLNALIANPDAPFGETREVSISLSSRVPGAIALELSDDLAANLRYLTRATDGFVEGRRDAAFSSEGLQEIPLALPSWASQVHGATAIIAGSCDANRTLPPVGPDATMLDASRTSDGLVHPAAEFALDGARTLALPIVPGHGFLTLSAVRVPLIVDRSGCEVRAVLLAEDELTSGPGVAIDGGAGKPVTVEATADGSEQWVTLPLQSPYTLPAGATVFVALHIVRGTATMAAHRRVGSVDAAGCVAPFRGPPAGPWELVPDSADLTGLRGRLRLTGTAPNDRPIAPVRGALARVPTSGDGITPGPKGVPVQLTGGGVAPVALQLVALTPCTLTVRDVVLTVSAGD